MITSVSRPEGSPRQESDLEGVRSCLCASVTAAGQCSHLQFSGMDVALPEDVQADLRAVLRQALTDVDQSTADGEVRVPATVDRLTAQVSKYGTGRLGR
jgi:hypothetical protein